MMAHEITIDKLTALQHQIVHAPSRGEIIVGGVAGSGKTTAAIYRAAYLCATTPRRKNAATVLFLCFNNTLRAAIQQQIRGFPSGVWSRVNVCTIHKWCARYVARRFHDYTVVKTDSERLALVRQAMRETRRMLGDLEVFERDAQLFLDEIRLIKGCDLRDPDDYFDLRLAHTGALSAEDYQALFAVAQAYDRLLRTAFRLDFDDFARIALSAIEQMRSPARYDHVIIDEAQDLSDCQLRLGRRLAHESLLLIADQAQAIYRVTQLPETLAEPGAYVLPESFRTTAAIFQHARQLLPHGQIYPLPHREGAPLEYHPFRWSDEEASFVAATIRRLLAAGHDAAEIAVLARYRALLAPVADALPPDAAGVQLLTIHEAKGREFRAVVVIGLVEGVLPCVRPEMDRVAVRQELALARRQLYVAMTRASEQLWLTASEGQLSRLLYEAGLIQPDAVEAVP